MLAAIYARKSTEQNGVNEEEKSVTRQIEHAKAYAEKKGWLVAEEHIYVDDGISGVEFVKRPGFVRMMTALKPKPPFQILIMSEESRLGRETIETAYSLKQLVTAGVRVFFYLEDRERTLETPMDKVMLSLTTFSDEMEREKVRQRTYDALLRKAKLGLATGGAAYGYDNVRVVGPTPEATHGSVIRQINETQAAVVRRIFAMCAAGKGYTAIAKILNEEKIPAPRPSTRGMRAWAGSAVREILFRETYRGVIVWGRTKTRNVQDSWKQRPRPETEWVRVEAPHLRIVTDAQWQAAHERIAATRAVYLRVNGGRLWGRPASGLESKYLLTGFACCAICGGSLSVQSRSHGRKRAFFYGCSTNHLRGHFICPNDMLLPMEETNREVLATLEQTVLHPAVVARSLHHAVEQARLSEDKAGIKREALEKELQALETERARLAQAIAEGGELTALLTALRDREQRIEHLHQELERLKHVARLSDLDLRRLERDLEGRLEDWQGLFLRHLAQTRQILRTLLVGRVRFSPKETECEFTGQASFGRILAGNVLAKALVSPTGFDVEGSNPLAFRINVIALAA